MKLEEQESSNFDTELQAKFQSVCRNHNHEFAQVHSPDENEPQLEHISDPPFVQLGELCLISVQETSTIREIKLEGLKLLLILLECAEVDFDDIYNTIVVNDSSGVRILRINVENSPEFIIPPKARFIMSDISCVWHSLLSSKYLCM